MSQILYSHTLKVRCYFFLRCPGCNEKYIGTADPILVTRLSEQGSRDYEPMYHHFSKCYYYNDIVNLMKLPLTDPKTAAVDKNEYILNAILSNFCIVGSVAGN